MEVREQTGIQKVALSGGSFQNRILLTKSIHILNKEGFEVFSQSNIPSNDGGIALGQMAIGAKRREMGLI
jgi:hydrogenase maturation protein HypF